MTDIFHEVEEDVRRERYEQIWKKHGTLIISVAVLFVLAIAGFQVWRNYELSQRQEFSARFQAAQQMVAAGNIPDAETEFNALIAEAPAGYVTLSKFQLAGVYLAQGRRDQGLALLRELSTLSDPVLSNVARLRLAWALADAGARTEIVEALQPLQTENNPWRFAAAEVLAYLDLREGSRLQAQAAYFRLSQEPAASANLRQRAAALSEYLASGAGAPAAGLPGAIAPALGANPP